MEQPADEAEVYALLLGKVIEQLRDRDDLSQTELARKAGVTQTAISRFERGQASPDPYELRGLAAAFGMSTTEFTALVDDAYKTAHQASKKVIPPKRTRVTKSGGSEWWVPVLAVVGAVGLVSLLALAVASLLNSSDDKSKKKRSGRGKEKDSVDATPEKETARRAR